MSTGLQSKAVDLDAIFDPYVKGTSPGVTGIQNAGADINTRYAPLSFGTQAPATGILCKPGGVGSLVDLNTLFAAYGSTNYPLAIDGQSYAASEGIPVSSSGSAQIKVSLFASGAYEVRAITTHGAQASPGQVLASGTWLPAGQSASNFQAKYTLTHTGGSNTATVSNPATSYASLASDCVFSETLGPFASASGTHNSLDTLVIAIKNLTTGAVSTTTVYLDVDTNGG